MFSTIGKIAAVCIFVVLVGCGGSTNEAKNEVTATSAAPPGDFEKIKEALKNAKMNPPVAVFDADDKTWSVVLAVDGAGPNGEPPPGGGRPIPERVLVGKGDFKITRFGNANAPRQPGGPGLEGRE